MSDRIMSRARYARMAADYDIGFVKSIDGTYDIVADWWGVRTTAGIEQERFVTQLNQRYAFRLSIAYEDVAVEVPHFYQPENAHKEVEQRAGQKAYVRVG